MHGLPLQPIDGTGILTFVVDHSSKRINKFQRWLLVAGIIAIGVLDVAFTSYLNGLDADPVAKTAVRTNAPPASLPVASNPFEQPAAQDELTTTAETSDSSSPADEISNRYFKASLRTGQNRKFNHINSAASRRQLALSVAQPFDCRVVSYPFIGTGVYVQVTDSTGCPTMSRSRNRRGNLLAKASPSSTKRWPALNTLVAKLK
jgi:hypothetical protein